MSRAVRFRLVNLLRCLYVDLEIKKKEAEEIKSKVKPRTIWDKPDIIDVTSNSLTLRWKPSSVPQYAVQVSRVNQAYRVAQIKIPHRTKCNFSTTV